MFTNVIWNKTATYKCFLIGKYIKKKKSERIVKDVQALIYKFGYCVKVLFIIKFKKNWFIKLQNFDG